VYPKRPSHEIAAVSYDMVNAIKAKSPLWEPMNPLENPFYGMTTDELRGMLGLQKRSASIFTSDIEQYRASGVYNLPQAFDARGKWGSCINPVNNQGKCAACWAFGITNAISDKFCIATNGAVQELSIQNFIACLFP